MNRLDKMREEFVRRSAPPVNEAARKQASEKYADLRSRFMNGALIQIRDALEANSSLRGIPKKWDDWEKHWYSGFARLEIPQMLVLHLKFFEFKTSDSECIYYGEIHHDEGTNEYVTIYRSSLRWVALPVCVGMSSLNKEIVKHRPREVWVDEGPAIPDDYNCFWKSEEDTPKIVRALVGLMSGESPKREFDPRPFIRKWR